MGIPTKKLPPIFKAVFFSAIGFLIAILLPIELGSLLIVPMFVFALLFALHQLYSGKWLIAMLLLFYISPILFIIVQPTYLASVYPLEYSYGKVELHREQLQYIFLIGLSSLLPGLFVMSRDGTWGRIIVNYEANKNLSIVQQILLGIIAIVFLFIGLPPGGGNVLTGGYVNHLQSTGAGVFLIISALLSIYIYANSNKFLVALPVIMFYFGWGLLQGRRVEQIGVLAIIFFIFLLRNGFKNNEYKIKKVKWYILVTAGLIALPIINLLFNYWGYIRIGEDFEWSRLTITTAPGIIYASSASLDLIQSGISPEGDMLFNYIMRFFGFNVVDYSIWVQNIAYTLGGMHVIFEPFAYYGKIGILLSSLIIIFIIHFAYKLDKSLGIIMFTPVFVLIIPRLIWYGYIYGLRLIQVWIIAFFIIIFVYNIVLKVEKRYNVNKRLR